MLKVTNAMFTFVSIDHGRPPAAGAGDRDRSRRVVIGRTVVSPVFGEAYVENLRRELTRAQARLSRAERERDRALAENAELRAQLAVARGGRRAQE